MQIALVKLLGVTAGIMTLTYASYSFALDNHEGHTGYTPTEIKWVVGPESLPKGTKVAILEGDPSKEGEFTLRLKMPANYRIPPHWHPKIEHLTIISGDFYLGMGDQLDEKHAMKFPVGSFVYMPAGSHHFAYTITPAVVQLHGVGPWEITYINPQDDPRQSKK